MQTCPKCNIKIRGNKRCCPLCEGKLTGEPEDPAFPIIKRGGVTRMSVIKMAAFVFLALEAWMGAALFLSHRQYLWMAIVMLAAPVVFIDLVLSVYFRNNAIKMVTFQTYIGMTVCLVIDYFTGFLGWSVAWVLPFGFLGMIIATISIGKGVGMLLRDYVIYLASDVIFAMLQIIFLVLDVNPFAWPAVITMTMIFISGLAGLFFRPRTLKNASSKMFHV